MNSHTTAAAQLAQFVRYEADFAKATDKATYNARLAQVCAGGCYAIAHEFKALGDDASRDWAAELTKWDELSRWADRAAH